MKQAVCIFLSLVLCSQLSFAFAKREVNGADYNSVGDFLADIEEGTKVSFDAYLFSTTHVDKDGICLSFPLLRWDGIKDSPLGIIYAKEEDLGDIYATSIGEEVTHYVHIEGIAEAAPQSGFFFVYIMDGQGTMKLIDPISTTYCLDEESNEQELKNKAINYLDKFEIKDGIVIKAGDTDIGYNNYQVWVSCGNYTIYLLTKEKQFYVEDHVSGIGRYDSFRNDGSVMISDAELSLIK